LFQTKCLTNIGHLCDPLFVMANELDTETTRLGETAALKADSLAMTLIGWLWPAGGFPYQRASFFPSPFTGAFGRTVLQCPRCYFVHLIKNGLGHTGGDLCVIPAKRGLDADKLGQHRTARAKRVKHRGLVETPNV
jgi:hypothetical protein